MIRYIEGRVLARLEELMLDPQAQQDVPEHILEEVPGVIEVLQTVKVRHNLMHLMGHKASCRLEDNPKYEDNAGHNDGENIERLHGGEKPLVYSTKRMLPSRREDVLTCHIGLRNCSLDSQRVLALKYKRLHARLFSACEKLARWKYAKDGVQVAGQPVDQDGIAMDWFTDDAVHLKPKALAVLRQLRQAIKPLEKDVQQQFDLLILQHELDSLDRDLAEHGAFNEATRALLHKEINAKRESRAKLAVKIQRLKARMKGSGVSTIVFEQLTDPAGRVKVLAAAVVSTVQRIEALKGLYTAARISMGPTGNADECKLRTSVRRRLSRQHKQMVKEVAQLNALLKPLQPLANTADAAQLLAKPIDIGSVQEEELWHAALLQVMQALSPDLTSAGADAAEEAVPQEPITQARVSAMNAVFDTLRVQEELVTWATEVIALSLQHYLKAQTMLRLAIRLYQGGEVTVARGLHPTSSAADDCPLPSQCTHGRFECGLLRMRHDQRVRNGLAAAHVDAAYQHVLAADNVWYDLGEGLLRKDNLIMKSWDDRLAPSVDKLVATQQEWFAVLNEYKRVHEEMDLQWRTVG